MVQVAARPSKSFVAPMWQRALLLLGALISIVGTLVLFRLQGWSLASVGLGALAVFAVAGFADSLLGRVELHPDTLVVVANFRRREYMRGQFKRATWEKGAPIALEYIEGGWLKLPDFVGGGPGAVSIFRSWLKGGKHAAEQTVPADAASRRD